MSGVTLQPYRPNYSKWEAHYKAMAAGNNLDKHSGIYVVGSDTQSGSGLQVVSQAEQVVQMAEAKKKERTKAKAKKTKARSPKRLRRVDRDRHLKPKKKEAKPKKYLRP